MHSRQTEAAVPHEDRLQCWCHCSLGLGVRLGSCNCAVFFSICESRAQFSGSDEVLQKEITFLMN